MRVNLDWLRDFVDLDADASAVADALTSSGLEVEGVEDAGAALDGIVVAQVAAVERHPNADRLSVCTVDDGAGRHQVVCGARNVAAGIRAPFARVGARLPTGKEIGAAELRGVKSNGMLCSAKELELVDDVDGLLLLDADAPVGAPLRDYLKLDDRILEINVTANRGDCFSVLGIARELAARLGKPLRPSRPRVASAALDDRFAVDLRAGDRCPRFAGRVVRDLRTGHRSPLWLRERLRRAGLRAIHPVVDVTNYVMLELGQPLHAYDLAKLHGGIVVRLAAPNEKLVLLDGRAVELADDMLVIADGRGPVGLAGVMGGQSTAVGPDTDAIFFEAAFFTPQALAGRARRLGLHTDASLRFERGVDPTQQARAIERATELLLEISGGSAGPLVVTERAADVPARPAVTLRPNRLRSVLGVEVPASEVEDLLGRLEMSVERAAGHWRVTPPAFRFDVSIEEDLIEEVGRMVGYDRIPSTPGTATARLGVATETHAAADRVVDTLAARGYSEAITYSFVDPKVARAIDPDAAPVALANPIASDLAVLRTSLWPGLLGAAKHNLSHQRTRLKLFELGSRFAEEAGAVRETAVLAGLAIGSRAPEHWDAANASVDYYDVKGDVEALLALTGSAAEFRFEAATRPGLRPGRTARILRGASAVGWLGELHPDAQELLDRKRAGVVFELEMDAAFAAAVPAFRGYSKFPSIRRDLAVVVDEGTSAATLVDAVRAAAGALLQHVVVFDVYRGTGVDSRRKSIGLGLILQDTSRTLTDADADQTMRSVTHRLERELGATIRT
jgi:phenylalanyl-tRNA synthetase beta chain